MVPFWVCLLTNLVFKLVSFNSVASVKNVEDMKFVFFERSQFHFCLSLDLTPNGTKAQ